MKQIHLQQLQNYSLYLKLESTKIQRRSLELFMDGAQNSQVNFMHILCVYGNSCWCLKINYRLRKWI